MHLMQPSRRALALSRHLGSIARSKWFVCDSLVGVQHGRVLSPSLCSLLSTGGSVHKEENEEEYKQEKRETVGERTRPLADSKWAETPFATQVFTAIGLKDFTEAELREAFERIDVNKNKVIEKDELSALCCDLTSGEMCSKECEDFTNKIWEYELKDQDSPLVRTHDGQLIQGITEAQFIKRTRALASEIDPRVTPIALTFLASGAAIGIIIPVMPQLVSSLGITSSQYGMIVGSFAGAKMLANIPAAALVDRFGRKPCLVAGKILIGASIGSIWLCSTYWQLMGARAITGIGVAAFTTAATMYLTDVSTPLNRAKTLAPAMTAFSAGAACGPAVGGLMLDNFGFVGTFGTVGSLFFLIAGMGSLFIKEIPRPRGVNSVQDEGQKAPQSRTAQIVSQWKRLLRNNKVMNITMLNAGYWFVLSGSQMTILPLILVSDEFGFSASMIGSVFAGMSAINIVMTPVVARLIDSIGQVQTVVPACIVIGCAMALAPTASDPYSFLSFVAAWTTAGTILSSAPTAFITDNVSSMDRAQALALLRTGGDIGMLTGAVTSGIVAQILSQPQTIQINGVLLLGVTTFAGFRLFRTFTSTTT